ncbi:MAG: septation protein IspZ [Bacteriovoracaceae bacterium]|nr:septation protein IspZ [Bacteriovoracaceae bacterium]
MTKKSKPFFLLSFLPAVAYWYLETHFSVSVAVIGGSCLATLELILEKIFSGRCHAISKLNFLLVVILGGFSLLSQDGIWFKLQPALAAFFMSFYWSFKLFYKKEGLLLEMMKESGRSVSNPQGIMRLEKDMVIFFIFYAFLMTGLALWGQTSVWVFFKTIGLYIGFAIFIIGEVLFMRFKSSAK